MKPHFPLLKAIADLFGAATIALAGVVLTYLVAQVLAAVLGLQP